MPMGPRKLRFCTFVKSNKSRVFWSKFVHKFGQYLIEWMRNFGSWFWSSGIHFGGGNCGHREQSSRGRLNSRGWGWPGVISVLGTRNPRRNRARISCLILGPVRLRLTHRYGSSAHLSPAARVSVSRCSSRSHRGRKCRRLTGAGRDGRYESDGHRAQNSRRESRREFCVWSSDQDQPDTIDLRRFWTGRFRSAHGRLVRSACGLACTAFSEGESITSVGRA